MVSSRRQTPPGVRMRSKEGARILVRFNLTTLVPDSGIMSNTFEHGHRRFHSSTLIANDQMQLPKMGSYD